MRALLASATALGIMMSGAAFAQSSQMPGSNAPSANQQGSSGNQASNVLTIQKLKQELQNSGFTDVTIVSEAFVVQAKTKDGNPVVMTIGPHGFTAFEALNANGSSTPNTTGSTGSSGGTGSTNPSTHK